MWLLNLEGADSGSTLMKREQDYDGARLKTNMTNIISGKKLSCGEKMTNIRSARLMKREGEGLIEDPPGAQLVKRAADIEEENRDYDIRLMKRNPNSDNPILSWRPRSYSLESLNTRIVDPEEFAMDIFQKRGRNLYGIRMMKRGGEEDGTRIIKKESEPYGIRMMKRSQLGENLDDEISRMEKKSIPYGVRMMKRDGASTRIIKKENEGYGLRLMKRENDGYGFRLMKRAGYGIRMMRRGERGGYGIRMMKARPRDELE